MSNTPLHFTDRLRIVADRIGTRKEAAEIAGVSLDSIIRHLRGENQPSFQTISRLCLAANMSMRWLATGEGEPQHDVTRSMEEGLPIQGFAESAEPGWFATHEAAVRMTLDIPDPHAYATIMHGQALIPEGVHPGFVCICSPMLKATKGDIVSVRRHDGLNALRLFMGEEGEWLVLKAYTDRDANGVQRAYEDKIKRSTVKEIAPVLFVKRKV